MARLLRGIVATAGAGSLVLLVACNGEVKRAAVSPAATTQAGATPLPPTATPRPAKLVVEPEPSFVPAAGASRTLVLRSASTSLLVDTDTGAVRELTQAPAAGDNSYYSALLQFPYVFSPDGASYAFACNDSGGSSGQEYRNNLCVSTGGVTVPDIVSRRGTLEQFGAYPPNVIAWSPDGRRIAFQKRNRDNAEVSDVYVVDLKTRATTRVITNAGHEAWGPVAWSPDGARFIVQRFPSPSAFNLVVVDAVTGDSTDLAADLFPPLEIPAFTWSPDGQEVAFVGIRPSTNVGEGLFVVPVSGGAPRKVLDGPVVGEQPAWSPDGRWIAVTLDVRDPGPVYFKYRVFVVRVDGSEERALPDGVTDSTGPSWAPDSSHIAVRASFNGRAGIVVTSIRGAAPIVVSGDVFAYPDFIAWSADGRRLFFIQEGGCGRGGCTPGFLTMADRDGGGLRRLDDQRISGIVSPGRG